MDYSNIVKQNLEQQILQQQYEQQQQQMLRDQQIRQQMEEQLKREQLNQEGFADNRPADEYWQIFDQAVSRIFKEWTALQLAITNEWGGRGTVERAEDMRQDILDLFLMGKQVYSDQIEKVLDECLSQDLNTVAEDDSYKQVAHMIIQSYNLCVKGAYQELVLLLGPETASVIESCVKGAGNDDDDEVDASEMGDYDDDNDNDDEMMDDDNDNMNESSATEKQKKYSEPDEDGWVTVNPKRK